MTNAAGTSPFFDLSERVSCRAITHGATSRGAVASFKQSDQLIQPSHLWGGLSRCQHERSAALRRGKGLLGGGAVWVGGWVVPRLEGNDVLLWEGGGLVFPLQDLDELGLLGRWRREMRCSVVQACLEVGGSSTERRRRFWSSCLPGTGCSLEAHTDSYVPIPPLRRRRRGWRAPGLIRARRCLGRWPWARAGP